MPDILFPFSLDLQLMILHQLQACASQLLIMLKLLAPQAPLTSFAFAWYTHHCEMPHATENKRLFIWLFPFT